MLIPNHNTALYARQLATAAALDSCSISAESGVDSSTDLSGYICNHSGAEVTFTKISRDLSSLTNQKSQRPSDVYFSETPPPPPPHRSTENCPANDSSRDGEVLQKVLWILHRTNFTELNFINSTSLQLVCVSARIVRQPFCQSYGRPSGYRTFRDFTSCYECLRHNC